MFPTSCILLCLTVAVSHQVSFTYVKPWDPFRRSATECEMCYNGDCVITSRPRCEYYAEARKLISDGDGDGDDDDDDEIKPVALQGGDKINTMLFELVDSASSISNFKGCVPFVSQYTDCTEETICIGCNFCTCNDEGKWICTEKQKCRPEPKLKIDHRVIGIVIENLKKKEKTQKKRFKRSDDTINIISDNIKDKVSYTDLSKWMYGAEIFNVENKNIKEILEYLNDKYNETTVDRQGDNDQSSYLTTVTSGSSLTTDMPVNKSDNYIDLLEFNDILQSWTTEELETEKSDDVRDALKTFTKHHSKESQINSVDYAEYDPIRFIKRDTSKLETNDSLTILQINTTSSNYSYELILTDAFQGLNKITTEKQKELEELLNIQNDLLKIARANNIDIDVNNNSTNTRDNYNKHHIAIYKLDTFEKCVAKIKHAIEDVIKTETKSNSSNLERDLKGIFSLIKKYVFHEDNKNLDTIISSKERNENNRIHIEPDNRSQIVNPLTYMSNFLVEINKTTANPLRTLSHHVRKILKRIIKQLYFDDFAVIDLIVHETYYDFDSYLENIGTKWNKMMQDIVDSESFDTFYRIKLLHLTLKADISKMEDMITLLDFARNRRMTIARGATVDKSILRIQDNLKIIDNNVQQIIQQEKNKRLRQDSVGEKEKPVKKKSIIQKLKKIFRSSKNDIKDMLRKRFSKSEIIKQIAKKKIDELERQKMLDYQETMNQWQENINVVSGREKRSSWGFKVFTDRIKSIIPGYLRGKVKPAMQKKTAGNKTQRTRTHGREKNSHTKVTTVKTTTVSRRSNET